MREDNWVETRRAKKGVEKAQAKAAVGGTVTLHRSFRSGSYVTLFYSTAHALQL